MTAMACTAACAAAAPYNPDHLGAAQLAHVAQVCQTVLGLQPSERPVWGVRPGNPHLAPGASHYQGCITSLSDSLQRALAAQSATLADRDCRARGLKPGSPELAVCVLHSLGKQPEPGQPVAANPIAARQTAPSRPARVGSFFYAWPHEVLRREQLACAQLGFEPPGGAFANCVDGLRTTFFAIDNPVE
jgi:hypothetical protein